jgi:hypothetical protein
MKEWADEEGRSNAHSLRLPSYTTPSYTTLDLCEKSAKILLTIHTCDAHPETESAAWTLKAQSEHQVL